MNKFYLSLIFLIVFIGHLMSPVMTSSDSRWSIHTALSIIREGNIDLDEYQDIMKNFSMGITKVKGHFYHYYSLGPSLIAVPFVFIMDKTIGMLFSKFPSLKDSLKRNIKEYIEKHPSELNRFKKYIIRYMPREFHKLSLDEVINNFTINIITLHPLIELFIASFIIALTAVFMYLISRLFLNIKYSLLISFIFGFCTLSWSVASRALWQHGPSMLMLTLSLYIILLAKTKRELINFLSLPLAFSYIIRPNIAIILFTVYVLIYYREHFIIYLSILSAIILLYSILNLFIYGSVLPSYYYYEATQSFRGKNLLSVLLANIISPGRGLFIYSPVFLFSIWGVVIKIKQKAIENLDLFLIAIVILHWLLISLYTRWHASWSFGQRYFSDMVPFFIYFLIYFVQKKIFITKGQKSTIFLKVLFTISIAASFFINFKGATRIETWLWNKQPVHIGIDDRRLWDWKDMPFLR